MGCLMYTENKSIKIFYKIIKYVMKKNHNLKSNIFVEAKFEAMPIFEARPKFRAKPI